MCVASSLLHGGIVRCVAMDSELLVSGASDATVRYWRAWPGKIHDDHPFVLTAEQPHKLAGKGAHSGPVSSLELTDRCLYTGSWDMTVRCWDRRSEQLESKSVWV